MKIYFLKIIQFIFLAQTFSTQPKLFSRPAYPATRVSSELLQACLIQSGLENSHVCNMCTGWGGWSDKVVDTNRAMWSVEYMKATNQSLTRGQKVQSRREREIWYSFLQFREEREEPEIPFPGFEKGKRNLKKGSPLSRSERERDFLFSSFKRRNEFVLKVSNFEKRKWNL